MKYGTVCSGIEAPSVAWESLGWKAQWFSEIEPFPKAVLAHHHPDVPDLGDMTKVDWNEQADVDVLIGGTPCQAFSIAGLRGGLADPRGNLALEFLRIVDTKRPRWFIWENVPGVLSSNGGRDFGSFLGAVVKLGYGFSYRILDAQYFGVPQRRRRVFVVGCLGGWAGASAVLLERESLLGNPAPSREKRQVVAANVAPSLASSGPPFSRTGNSGVEADALVVMASGQANAEVVSQGSPALNCNRDGAPIVFQQNSRDEVRMMGGDGQVAGALMAQPGAKQQNYIAFHPRQCPISGDVAPPCETNGPMAVAFNGDHTTKASVDVAGTMRAEQGGEGYCVVTPIDTMNHIGRSDRSRPFVEGDPSYTITKGHSHAVQYGLDVRRLTEIECERLQGFPDNYTQIEWRGKAKEDCPLGHRYKALGNSMAVPVIKWIGERIMAVESAI